MVRSSCLLRFRKEAKAVLPAKDQSYKKPMSTICISSCYVLLKKRVGCLSVSAISGTILTKTVSTQSDKSARDARAACLPSVVSSDLLRCSVHSYVQSRNRAASRLPLNLIRPDESLSTTRSNPLFESHAGQVAGGQRHRHLPYSRHLALRAEVLKSAFYVIRKAIASSSNSEDTGLHQRHLHMLISRTFQ